MAKNLRRYIVTAACLGLCLLGLSLVNPDIDLATELVAERLSLTMLGELNNQKSLAQSHFDLEGPAPCLKGLNSGIKRSRFIGQQKNRPRSESLRLQCEVAGGDVVLTVQREGRTHRRSRSLPKWWAVFPPILAVFIALGTRKLLLGLALAVWSGALLSKGIDITLGIWPAFRDFLWYSVWDRFRITVVLFTSALVGMANVTTRAGGAQGVAQAIARLAKGTRSTRLATFLMGLALFFDDYANCIVVGTTMRPLADRVKLSREKLAYIVDSTSAPVAGVAIISTWIGYEVSLFDDLSQELSLGLGGYDLFLRVLPTRFYCFLTLFFVVISTVLSRDFGPMFKAEKRAQEEGKVLADDAQPLTSRILSHVTPAEGIKPRWFVAGIPVAIVILVTMLGLIWSGSHSPDVSRWVAENNASIFNFQYLRLCLQNANGAFILLLAALSGSFVAFILALLQKSVGNKEQKQSKTSILSIFVAVILPFTFAAIVTSIHTVKHVQNQSIWSAQFWHLLYQRHETQALLIGSILLSLILGATMVSRKLGERKNSSVYPLGLKEIVLSWFSGARAMVLAIAILVLAWSIQKVCQDLDTSIFLVSSLSGVIDPLLLPVLVFLLAGAVAFSTGTSWGTMGILIPTVMPLAHHFGGLPLLLVSAGAVLDGAIFGDHCSPISDTTVMSSMATSCDHIHHVKTQLPYALTCMGIAIVSYLAVTSGVSSPLVYLGAVVLIVAILRFAGKQVGKVSSPQAE